MDHLRFSRGQHLHEIIFNVTFLIFFFTFLKYFKIAFASPRVHLNYSVVYMTWYLIIVASETNCVQILFCRVLWSLMSDTL